MNGDIEGTIGRRPTTDSETLYKMLAQQKQNTDNPVNTILPTGNLKIEEIKYIRRLQEIYNQLKQVQKWLGFNDNDIPFMQNLVEEINFFVESSKSLNGFASTLMVTKNTNMFQDLEQKLKDDKQTSTSIMDKLGELANNADDDLGIQAPDTSTW